MVKGGKQKLTKELASLRHEAAPADENIGLAGVEAFRRGGSSDEEEEAADEEEEAFETARPHKKAKTTALATPAPDMPDASPPRGLSGECVRPSRPCVQVCGTPGLCP